MVYLGITPIRAADPELFRPLSPLKNGDISFFV
jgi:hypothetical protein